MQVSPRDYSRDLALDVMRGLAIVSMVAIHSRIYFPPRSTTLYNAVGSLGTLAAPFFLICAGMGVGYLQGRYAEARVDLSGVLLRRGLFLAVFATSLGLVHLDLYRLIDWDIFTLIGAMYIFIATIGGLGWRGALAGIGVVILVNLFLPVGMPRILRGGSFPPIPFAIYFLAGLIFVALRDYLRRPTLAYPTACLAVAVNAAAAIFRSDHLTHVTRFDSWSTAGILVIVAIFLALWVLAMLVEACWRGFTRAVIPVGRLGRLSFSLYYVQYFFLFLVPQGVGLILHRNMKLSLPNLAWVAALILFLGWLYLIVVIWARFGFKLSLEWFVSTYISPRSMFTTSSLSETSNRAASLSREANDRV